MLANLKAAEKARQEASSHRSSGQDASRINRDDIAQSQADWRQDASRLARDSIAESQGNWRQDASRLNRDAYANNMDWNARQLMIESLSPKEQAEQDAWRPTDSQHLTLALQDTTGPGLSTSTDALVASTSLRTNS